MRHLEDGDLILYHYRDGNVDAATQHLDSCSECRKRLEELSATLQLVSAPEPPPRPEDYGTQVWNRVRAHLAEPEPRPLWWWRRVAVATAFAGLLLAAFLLGRYGRPQPQPTTIASTVSAPANASVTPQQVQERVLLVALGDHLDRSQMLLVELAHAGGTGQIDISTQQQLAAQLADSNRLYRDTARQVGDTSISNALDELERVLLEIMHEPSSMQADQLQEIQERIQKQEILFKVRVIRNNMQHELLQSKPGNTSKEQNI
ncbi:MAG: hypothetical protein JOY79_02630 [Acidobacteriaceae bacterium]|nr:hypothetical protein [Acidobacteriaceae bacterium]